MATSIFTQLLSSEAPSQSTPHTLCTARDTVWMMYMSSTLTSLCKAHAHSHLAAWDTFPVVTGKGKVQPKSWTGQTTIREFRQDHHQDKTAERGCNSTRSTTEAAAMASTLQEQYPVYKSIHSNIHSTTSASTLQQQHLLYNKSIHSTAALQQEHPLYSCSTTRASTLQLLYNKSIHSTAALQQEHPLCNRPNPYHLLWRLRSRAGDKVLREPVFDLNDQRKNIHSNYFNRVTSLVSLKNDQWKCKIWNLWAFLSSFSCWYVKGVSSKCIALKVDMN